MLFQLGFYECRDCFSSHSKFPSTIPLFNWKIGVLLFLWTFSSKIWGHSLARSWSDFVEPSQRRSEDFFLERSWSDFVEPSHGRFEDSLGRLWSDFLVVEPSHRRFGKHNLFRFFPVTFSLTDWFRFTPRTLSCNLLIDRFVSVLTENLLIGRLVLFKHFWLIVVFHL